MALTVIVRDRARQKVASIDRFDDLSIVARFNDVGTWTLKVPADAPQASLLVPGGGILIYRSGLSDPLMSGPLTHIERSIDENSPGTGGTITFSGVDDLVAIRRRIALPVPTSAPSSQAGSYSDVRSGAAETVIRGYVDANAGPGALAARRVGGLTLAPDLARGSALHASARMTNLLALISPLGRGGGVGFRVVQVGTALQFQVYVPVDRSSSARFSRALGNLRSMVHVVSAPETTRAVSGGGGAGTARVFGESIDVAAEAAWALSAETFIDSRDTTVEAELLQSRLEALTSGGPAEGLTIATADVPSLCFGIDYGLGDKVTVEAGGGVKVVDVLREVQVSYSTGSGERITSQVGTSQTTGTPKIVQALGRVTRQLALLQERQ